MAAIVKSLRVLVFLSSFHVLGKYYTIDCVVCQVKFWV